MKGDEVAGCPEVASYDDWAIPELRRREKWGGEGGRGEGEGVVPRSAEPLWLSKPGTGTV